MKHLLTIAALLLGVCERCSSGALAQERAAAKDEGAEGLVAHIYDIGEAIEDFPDIPKDKKPTLKKVDKTIDVNVGMEKWPDTDLDEHFFIRWTGKVKIPKDGKYKFFVESDDGSRLYINDKRVVHNPGLHGMFEQSGEIELKAGEHEIKLEMFENEGEAGCKLSWEGPGIAKEVVPASALTHKKSEE
jgi:hypothetical protein